MQAYAGFVIFTAYCQEVGVAGDNLCVPAYPLHPPTGKKEASTGKLSLL